jgi:hypothetical protein
MVTTRGHDLQLGTLEHWKNQLVGRGVGEDLPCHVGVCVPITGHIQEKARKPADAEMASGTK